MHLGDNKIHRGELAFVYLDFQQEWRRTLFYAKGTYVEIDLTSRGGVQSWDQVRSINVRKHNNARSQQDRVYRCVNSNSPVFKEVVDLMSEHLTPREVATLLFQDFLYDIDWQRFGIRNFQQSFLECKK